MYSALQKAEAMATGWRWHGNVDGCVVYTQGRSSGKSAPQTPESGMPKTISVLHYAVRLTSHLKLGELQNKVNYHRVKRTFVWPSLRELEALRPVCLSS